MFSYDRLSGRSNLEKISIHDLFDDVKLTSDGTDLKGQGYIVLATENVWLGLKYMAKPTKAVVDYMVNSGRGEPSVAEIGLNNSIAFSAYWSSERTSMTTTPRIAGVVEQEELDAFKKSAELVGDCIVKKAYDAFHALHPNFALRSVREPVGGELSNIQRHAKLLWTAVGYALDNNDFKESAEKGEFDAFYLDQEKLDFLNAKFGIKVPMVAKSKIVSTESSLGF